MCLIIDVIHWCKLYLQLVVSIYHPNHPTFDVRSYAGTKLFWLHNTKYITLQFAQDIHLKFFSLIPLANFITKYIQIYLQLGKNMQIKANIYGIKKFRTYMEKCRLILFWLFSHLRCLSSSRIVQFNMRAKPS